MGHLAERTPMDITTHHLTDLDDLRRRIRQVVPCGGARSSRATRALEMFAGDEALATAILDRLLHHCHVVSIDGKRYRLKHLAEQGRSPQPLVSRKDSARK